MTDFKEKLEKLQHEVTDKIVADLKRYQVEGKSPAWIKPWRSTGSSGLPQNLDGRLYSGINVLILQQAQESKDYPSNRWGTYKAIKDRGGMVLKGETATSVFFYKSHFVKRKNLKSDETVTEGQSSHRNRIYLLRNYNLFNLSQTTVEPDGEKDEISEETKYLELSNLIDSSQAVIEHGYSKACYRLGSDRISMPGKSRFKTEEDYWATLLHEMVHWTGHGNRLDRFEHFSYATEELIAELGASFLCAEYNIEGDLQHSEYIHSWIKEMEDDYKLIFKAAARASQAHRLIKENHSTLSSSGDEVAA